MKKLFLGLIGVILITLTSFTKTVNTSTECDINALYSGIEPENNTLVLTSDGNLESAKLILVPTTIDKGNYAVSITRKGANLYKIDGKNIYIQTKYCYEYSYSQDVILKIESAYGYSKGKIIF